MSGEDCRRTSWIRHFLNFELREPEPDDGMPILGTTALMLAAGNGDVLMLRMLIDAGATLDGRDHRGWEDADTAVTIAASRGHLDALRELLKAGARVDAGRNFSALAVVLHPRRWRYRRPPENLTEAVRIILENGGNPHGAPNGKPPLELLSEANLPPPLRGDLERLIRDFQTPTAK
jgi:ankyrin repeat protein